MHDFGSIIVPPYFCAGLAPNPPGLLEVEKNYIGMNIFRIKSKGFMKIITSAYWPFRKWIKKRVYNCKINNIPIQTKFT